MSTRENWHHAFSNWRRTGRGAFLVQNGPADNLAWTTVLRRLSGNWDLPSMAMRIQTFPVQPDRTARGWHVTGPYAGFYRVARRDEVLTLMRATANATGWQTASAGVLER